MTSNGNYIGLPFRSRIALGLIGILIVFALWSSLTYTGLVRGIFLPTPTSIFEGFVTLQARGWLFSATVNSLRRIVSALSIALIVGIPIGMLLGLSNVIDAMAVKIVQAMKAVPITGLIGVITLWFGFGDVGKVAFLVAGSVFYIIVLVRNAVRSLTPLHKKVARGLGARPWQVVVYVILPGILPQIWDAIIVANGLGWTYIVLSEFLGASESRIGLGYIVYISSRTQNTGLLFATLILIGSLAAMTEQVLLLIRRRLFSWQQ